MSDKTINIEQLKYDDKNFNQHTEFGMALLEKSLRENGAGRSILVDNENNIIAGNGIVEAAVNAGFKKVKVVEVQGDELVAVKRTDLKLDSKKGREMALADNATAAADLSWDAEQLKLATEEFELDPNVWGVMLKEDKPKDEKPSVPFTEILNEESNYIVLYFNDSVDWLQAQTLFKLEQVKSFPTSKVAGKGTCKVGLGRVVNGSKALDIIFEKLGWR